MEGECEARRRTDTILVQLSAANAEQARTIRAVNLLQEVSEDAETVEDEPEASENLDPQPQERRAKGYGRTEAAELVAAHFRGIGANRVIQRQKNRRLGRGVARLDLWCLASGGSLGHAAGSYRWCSARRSGGNDTRTNLGASKPLTSPQTAAQRRP